MAVAVVDVAGSVFEWANCAASESDVNLHVGEGGSAGDELVWWYGGLFGLA